MFQLLSPGVEPQTLMLQNIIGKSEWTILYFYPKDNTPGCTAEAIEFTALAPEFKKMKTQIV